MSNASSNTPHSMGSGLGLKPGDAHYRAFVGPPEDYDLIAAMVFNLLTSVGLRQHHRVLDIGCGSLRVGRLLIPYLNAGNYYGIEPERWLVNDGIANEVGTDLIRIKQPQFSFRDSLAEFTAPLALDYAVAQSVFSHCALPLIRNWLAQLSLHLKDEGALFATFLVDGADFEGAGWVYPQCVKYRPETLARIGEELGYGFQVLDWWHPRQAWAVFSRPAYDKSLLTDGTIAWNRIAARFPG